MIIRQWFNIEGNECSPNLWLKNGCDVNAYRMLGRTKARALLSVHGKIHERQQKGGIEGFHVTSHRKTQMSHLTHLSHSGSVHGQNDSKICKKMSLSVSVVTHYGSNESNDSFGFFCACQANFASHPTRDRHVGFLLRGRVWENTTKCLVTFFFSSYHITILRQSDKNIKHTHSWNFKSCYEVNQK